MLSRLKNFSRRAPVSVAQPGSWRHRLRIMLRAVYRTGAGQIRRLRRWRADLGYVSGAVRHDSSQWYRVRRGTVLDLVLPAFRGTGNGVHPATWYHVDHVFLSEHEHIEMDLDYAVREGQAEGIALVFFMGMGDYLFATPVIHALRERFPTLPIIAYTSRNASRNNSPLVADLVALNPDVDERRTYAGRPGAGVRNGVFPDSFKTYDYSDALATIPDRYLAVPVLYEHRSEGRHRLDSLYRTFMLAPPADVPKPLIHLPDVPSKAVTNLLDRVTSRVERGSARGVIFLQVDARSSQFQYPHTDVLAAQLADRGYVIVSASAVSGARDDVFEIDVERFSIVDSIHLLKLLKSAVPAIYVVSVASVFWAVSAGLEIPNLGMQHFIDEAMHNYWYKNIFVVSHYTYPRIPRDRLFVAGSQDVVLNEQGRAVFAPDYVCSCFDQMVAQVCPVCPV